MKKIAVNTVKSFLFESKQDTTITRKYSVEGSEFEVKIRTKLTTDEKSAFISRVLSGCFDARQNFRPEYVTPMLRATILQMCTNIPVITAKGDTTEDGDPVLDINAMDEVYCALNLDRLDDHAYQVMLNEIVQLTHNAIDWKRSRVLADIKADGSRAIREVVGDISELISKLDMDKLVEYAALLSKNTEGLDTGNLIGAILKTDGRTAA